MTKIPRYQSQPATQTPKVEDGQIVGWTLRMTLQSNGISHTEEWEYECSPDEIEPVPGDIKKLEQILTKVIEETTFLENCEAALEAKINGSV